MGGTADCLERIYELLGRLGAAFNLKIFRLIEMRMTGPAAAAEGSEAIDVAIYPDSAGGGLLVAREKEKYVGYSADDGAETFGSSWTC